MPRKAIDSRIPTLIRNGIQEKKRSFVVVVGDRAKDVIVHLHYIMSSVDIKQNRSVLWAYKKDLLGFTSHRKKREKKIRKEIKRGIREPNDEDPFELFVSLHNIRYVYYKETDKILGNTYGMCILQDFEAITPNLLARTIETVEGGGLVLLLLKGMKSLKQLYTLSMDVHSRYRTEAHNDVTARFNERFILSLGACDSCLVVDDELNVLPISGGKSIEPLPPPDEEASAKAPAKIELLDIKEKNESRQLVGALIKLAKTVDQAKALVTFVDAITEKTLRSTVTLTAARGRGKSAALGVAIAAAVAFGYSNIFITSPSPENLKTLFEFLFKGFDALGYLDHNDYTIIQSTNPGFNKAIVRVNIHRQHRQTVQYIQPQDAYTLGQAELLVIDEAAAIPLPFVKKLIGPYLVFMASTINGYEGTGRSLSLKLIQQLREQSRRIPSAATNGEGQAVDRDASKAGKGGEKVAPGRRSLREITLSEPIRYAAGDSVERWLNRLLCLDATLPRTTLAAQGCPHPSECQLLHVNRDTLFSFHPVSEKFLEQMMALYVASHYKNSPNDLQLMSDAPGHQLFVLVPPIAEDSTRLPEPLCVVQVALEGQISRQSVLSSLGRGQRASGDLIPWLVSQQFQDEDFAGLSGARVIRIATNPEYTGMGYGSRALSLLIDFYEHRLISLTEPATATTLASDSMPRVTDADLESASLLADDVRVRDIAAMPPLFARLAERAPPALDYLGVAYGLTAPLHRFWARAGFAPVYLRQTPNELTGEHSCVTLRALARGRSDPAWLAAFAGDFQRRLHALLGFGRFRGFPAVLALSIDEAAAKGAADEASGKGLLTKAELDALLSPFDLKRLDAYAANMLDHHVVLDTLPTLAALHFTGRLRPRVRLSGVQAALLLAVGLQRKDVDDLAAELQLPAAQLLAMFVKTVRKICAFLRELVEGEAAAGLPAPEPEQEQANGRSADQNGEHGDQVLAEMEGDAAAEPSSAPRLSRPLAQDLNEELREGGMEIDQALKEKQRALIDALPLDRYEIPGKTDEWTAAEAQVDRALARTTAADEDLGGVVPTVSVRSEKAVGEKRKGQGEGEASREGKGEKRRKGAKAKR